MKKCDYMKNNIKNYCTGTELKKPELEIILRISGITDGATENAVLEKKIQTNKVESRYKHN